MPMIAATTISSMSVKPRSRRRASSPGRVAVIASPVLVVRAIERFPVVLRVDIVDVLLTPRARVRVVLVRPLAPLLRLGERVERDAPQELDLLAHGADLLDAVGEHVEIGRVAFRVDPLLRDEAGVAVLLVLVD